MAEGTIFLVRKTYLVSSEVSLLPMIRWIIFTEEYWFVPSATSFISGTFLLKVVPWFLVSVHHAHHNHSFCLLASEVGLKFISPFLYVKNFLSAPDVFMLITD